MNFTNNLFKILISFLVIVSSTISISQNSIIDQVEIYSTQIVKSKKDSDSDKIEYDLAQKLLLSYFKKNNPIALSGNFLILECYNDFNLKFKTQNNNHLNYKSTLQKVTLNEIISQKSHWI